MFFRMQSGTHYHVREGCHGATLPCVPTSLEPCSDCLEGITGASPSDGDGALGLREEWHNRRMAEVSR